MRNAQYRTWNMTRKQKNMKNDTQTNFDLEYGGKTQKRGKLEMHTEGPGIRLRKLKIMENEKLAL
jgi:hypothetical protein